MTIRPIGLFIALSVLSPAVFGGGMTLWYQQPAKTAITEALPVGNGRFGGLILGTPDRERIVLNEDSLWTGDANPSGDYATMGAYQVLGDLFINLPGHSTFSDYRRDLNLNVAVANVGYVADGVSYGREYFCSRPAGVFVARLSAGKSNSYTGSIELKDSHGAATFVDGKTLAFAGALANGLKYECRVVVVPDGGTVTATSNAVVFTNCNRLTIFVAAGTDYAMSRGFRGRDPHDDIVARLGAAAHKTDVELKAEHFKDYCSLFNSMDVDFGASTPGQQALPTDQRRVAAGTKTDPELEALLFQYGRYLMISCSRPGGLPANLQGLWNDTNNPPWHSDYHANINIQMNYWPAEVANLSECQLPFGDLIQSQLPEWRKATAADPEFASPQHNGPIRGFAIRTSHNIFGGMAWK